MRDFVDRRRHLFRQVCGFGRDAIGAKVGMPRHWATVGVGAARGGPGEGAALSEAHRDIAVG